MSTAKHAAGIKQMSALGWRHSMPRRLQKGREAAGRLVGRSSSGLRSTKRTVRRGKEVPLGPNGRALGFVGWCWQTQRATGG